MVWYHREVSSELISVRCMIGLQGTGDHAGARSGGVPGPGLSPAETVAHMSMWVMAASPLLTCNDVRNMSADIKEILTNPEVLAVHKDPLARMAVRIDVGGGVEEAHASIQCASEYSVYGRVLHDGSSAVMILNRGESNVSVTLHAEDIGDSMHTTYGARDLWAQANLSGAPVVDVVTLTVPVHGVRLLRLWPMPPAPPRPPPPPGPQPPPPPPPPAHGNIPSHKQPMLQYLKTIAFEPEHNLRDPSPAIQDPATGYWHFWVDWMPTGSSDGWGAWLKHYTAPAITGPWVSRGFSINGSHGFAINHSRDPSAWDYSGQFSSSVIYDAAAKTWWLFYSASGLNQSRLLTNAQMVCSSSTPDGPWVRRGLAAWPTGSNSTSPPWSANIAATPSCKAGQAKCWNSRFVDSGRALIVGGRRAFWTKGVEGNYPDYDHNNLSFSLVASEGVYLPSSSDSFAPPYREAAGNPVYSPFGRSGEDAGYENCEFFMGHEDQLFHILCTFDGGTVGPPGLPRGVHPHFVVNLTTDPFAENWTYVGAIGVHNKSTPGIGKAVPIAGEPTPVYENGPPGDNATVRYFIAREDGVTHGGPGSLRIGLFSLSWVDPAQPSPPSPPVPSPPPACPVGWVTHAPGFWRNTDPCPNNHFGNCTADIENGTVALCHMKCVLAPGCVAFDTCAKAGTVGCGCYIFVGGMVTPFTPNPGDLTCVRHLDAPVEGRVGLKVIL
jgi:hypothetical protein